MATKKRQPRNKALAHEIRDRLEELRREEGLNYTEFANAAGVPRPQYNAWRNSGVVPGGFYLRGIAERLGVTTDWLLCIEGAPKFRGQTRGPAELEADLAAHVAREVATTFSVDVGEVAIYPKRLVQGAVRAGVEQFRKDRDRYWWKLTGDEDTRRFHQGLLALDLRRPSDRQRQRRQRDVGKVVVDGKRRPQAAGHGSPERFRKDRERFLQRLLVPEDTHHEPLAYGRAERAATVLAWELRAEREARTNAGHEDPERFEKERERFLQRLLVPDDRDQEPPPYGAAFAAATLLAWELRAERAARTKKGKKAGRR